MRTVEVQSRTIFTQVKARPQIQTLRVSHEMRVESHTEEHMKVLNNVLGCKRSLNWNFEKVFQTKCNHQQQLQFKTSTSFVAGNYAFSKHQTLVLVPHEYRRYLTTTASDLSIG